MYKGWVHQKRLSSKTESLFIFVRRKGMSKPPVKLGVDKSWVIGQNELVFNPKDRSDTN